MIEYWWLYKKRESAERHTHELLDSFHVTPCSTVRLCHQGSRWGPFTSRTETNESLLYKVTKLHIFWYSIAKGTNTWFFRMGRMTSIGICHQICWCWAWVEHTLRTWVAMVACLKNSFLTYTENLLEGIWGVDSQFTSHLHLFSDKIICLRGPR